MSLNHVLAGVVLIVTLITIVLAVYKVTVRNLRKRMVTAHATQALKTSAESYWEEKRQDPRIGIVWPVSLETSQGEVKAKIKDLSLGGAFIACRDPLSLKEQFNLTINLPDQKPLTLVSEVVWSNSNVLMIKSLSGAWASDLHKIKQKIVNPSTMRLSRILKSTRKARLGEMVSQS